MKELQQRQQLKKRLYSLPALVFLVFATLLILRGTYVVIQKERESARMVKELQAKVSSLSERQEELKNNISKLETDEGIDAEIKERFSVSRPGEHVVVLVDQDTPEATSTPHKEPWYKIWMEKMKSL